METPEEARETYIGELANLKKEYILSNGAELNEFFMRHLDIVEELANLISIHWNRPDELIRHIQKQLNDDLDRETFQDEADRLGI